MTDAKPTKSERREEKRRRRAEEHSAAAAVARRRTYRNAAIVVALAVVLGGLGWLAVGNRTATSPDVITVSAEEVDAAREASGCEVLQVTPIASSQHHDPAVAPPADALYTEGRPTATGPHYINPGPVFSGVRDEQLDERATTHNMEHGSVIIWFDPDQLDEGEVDELDELVGTLNGAGFANDQGRAGIFASPFTDPGIDSGKAVAIRSWGQAMDCEQWDVDYAYGWIAEHFGSRGPAPEGSFGPYPDGVLELTGPSGAGNTEQGDDG